MTNISAMFLLIMAPSDDVRLDATAMENKGLKSIMINILGSVPKTHVKI